MEKWPGWSRCLVLPPAAGSLRLACLPRVQLVGTMFQRFCNTFEFFVFVFKETFNLFWGKLSVTMVHGGSHHLCSDAFPSELAVVIFCVSLYYRVKRKTHSCTALAFAVCVVMYLEEGWG